jgi:hypothetical protein
MSKKSEFLAVLMSIVAALSGSHLTREARTRTIHRFVEMMFGLGFTHFSKVGDIAGRHVRAYVAQRMHDAVRLRTIQNELAHLRSVLKRGGAVGVASACELSNRTLGVGGASREGTKTAMSDEQLKEVRERAISSGRPGFAALLGLERHLGLRGNEAIHARTDTLERWLRELDAEGVIRVISGTKGGMARRVRPLSMQAARESITYALKIAQHQGGFLVQRADKLRICRLDEARSIYHGWCNRAGVEPHAARYAFARDQVHGYMKAGMSEREALAATSLDLGHGDGRGRWIKSVYMR